MTIRNEPLKRIVRLIERNMASDQDSNLAQVTADTPLLDVWQRMDSMQVITLVIELESEYGLSLPDELLGNMTGSQVTVGDLAAFILEGRTKAQA
ncbi:acyl carrier protein [Cohnella sp. CFH 77786]|uniref:acyl carrier protein n=1 Tax=Cohnella sp. CFH 77786 TaxID=2662265 RepID=UPI001C60DEB0